MTKYYPHLALVALCLVLFNIGVLLIAHSTNDLQHERPKLHWNMLRTYEQQNEIIIDLLTEIRDLLKDAHGNQ